MKAAARMPSSDTSGSAAVILDLESQRVPIAIAFRHRRVGVGESDRGDPIAALRIGLGLDRPREPHIGNPIIDEGDVAHARLDDRVLAPDILGTGSIVVAEEARPALLLAGCDRIVTKRKFSSAAAGIQLSRVRTYCARKYLVTASS
jgi:hypothetical protein